MHEGLHPVKEFTVDCEDNVVYYLESCRILQLAPLSGKAAIISQSVCLDAQLAGRCDMAACQL